MSDMSVFSVESPLLLVGCGNMGRALVRGWLSSGLKPEALLVLDPAANDQILPEAAGARFVANTADLPAGVNARLMLLAVKPQVMNSVLQDVRPYAGKQTLAVSVAAGVTMDQMRRGLGKAPGLVRAMPNTPAAVGAGVTGLVAEAGVSQDGRALADLVMHAAGRTVWIENEELMDAVTATSGSGPAYVFHMVEALASGAEAAGLPADEAMTLARQTVIGAARLLEAGANLSAAELRRRVTSPGGTTAAALDVLMASDGLVDLMTRAVAAARKRGRELAD